MTVRDIWAKVENRLWTRIGLFKSIDIKEIKSRELTEDYKVKVFTIKDSDLLREYALSHRSKEHYTKNILPRLENTDRYIACGVLNLKNNEIAYLSWIDLKEISIKEVDVYTKCKANEAYFVDDHCVGKYQRKGLHQAVFNYRLKKCKELNINTIYIVIYLNNYRAIKSLKKYNFKINKTFCEIWRWKL